MGAGNGPHSGPRNSSFALATVRADGFASVAGTGTVRTRPLRCTGPTLVVTADVLGGGSVRVGVANAKGLAPADSTPVGSNTTDHAVEFTSRATLAPLVGTEIVLELVLDRAAVFTVGFSRDAAATKAKTDDFVAGAVTRCRALLMVALAAPVRSFDPEWLRPRYHYGKQGLLGNYVSAAAAALAGLLYQSERSCAGRRRRDRCHLPRRRLVRRGRLHA